MIDKPNKSFMAFHRFKVRLNQNHIFKIIFNNLKNGVVDFSAALYNILASNWRDKNDFCI
jgi:hypothetical protein